VNWGFRFVRRPANVRAAFLLLGLLALAGCGGGGGGGGSAKDLSINTSAINFSVEEKGTLPAVQSFDISWTKSNVAAVLVGVPPSESVPSWIDLSVLNSNSPLLLQVGVNTTYLTPGTYSMTLRLVSVDSSSRPIDVIDIPVTYKVTAAASLSANPASLSFSADETVAPAAQTVALNVNTGSMPAWSAGVQYQGSTTGWLSLTPNTSNNTIQVAVNPLGAGTYNANILVSYTTAGGNQTLSIPVTYTSVSIAVVSQSSLAFTAVEGQVPAAQDLTISFGSLTPSWSAQVNYTSGTNWLTLTQTGGTLSVQAAAQLRGSYAATIQISYTLGATPSVINIPVSYTVLPPFNVSNSSISFNIGKTTTSADISQTIVITDNYTDGTHINWTASTDVDWLELSPINGDTNTNNSLVVSVNPNKVAHALSQPTANIIITPNNTSITPLSIPVTVSLTAPMLLNVTPNVRYNGHPSDVIIRGAGFNSLTSETISFNGTQAGAVNIISDTEMHVTPPASVYITDGTYHVTLDGASVLDLSSADLHIVTPPTYTATTVPLSGVPKNVIYDPLRNAVYYTTASGIYKLSYVSGTTWNESSSSLANAVGIALNPDSQSLFVTNNSNDFYPYVNPDSLSLGTSVHYTSVYSSFEYFDGPAPMNNGTVVLTDSSAYGDLLLYPSMTHLIQASSQYLNIIYSDNRDVAVFGGDPYAPPLAYDASDGSITTFSAGTDRVYRTSSAISEDALRSVVRKGVYDNSYTYLGDLDTTATPVAVAVTADGTRAYTLNNNLISTYDISGTAGPFPQVGAASAYTADTTVFPLGMILSQDGSTLFIYDSSNLYVYPIP